MIKYKEDYKYQLVEDYKIRLLYIMCSTDIITDFIELKGRDLLIKKGYSWDGPSGPAIDTKAFMKGSLVHDVLYQLMRLKLLPQMCRYSADNELRDICLENGMNRIRVWWVYWGVRLFARFAADPENKKKVLVAP